MNDRKQTQSLKVAVWNLRGPGSLKKSAPGTAEKIKRLARKIQPDLAFYLEAPTGTVAPLPGIVGNRFDWVGTDPDHGNPKGILAVRYTRAADDSTGGAEYTDHRRPSGKTAMKFDLSPGGRPVRLIAVWMSPAKTQQKDYMDCLKEVLKQFADPEKKLPLIVAGDTNIVTDSRDAAKDYAAETGEADPKRFLEELRREHGLILLNPPGTFTHRKYRKEKKTGKIIEQSFFQCDLLLASEGLVNASDPAALSLRVLLSGGAPEGLAEEFDMWGSDHLPLVFEISAPGTTPDNRRPV